MSEATKDRLARFVAIASLLVAVVAIFVPYFQQQSQFEKQNEEELSIILNPNVNGPLILTKHNFGAEGMVVQMPWELTISNIGNRQLSIIKKSMSRGDIPDSVYYSGVDGGMVTNDYKKVKLPLKLEVGESKSFLVYVGTIVPKQVIEILSNLNNGNPISDRDAMKALAEKGMDLYGNKVRYHAFESGEFSIVFEEAEKSPVFWIRLSTGSGNNFFASASKYGLPQ